MLIYGNHQIPTELDDRKLTGLVDHVDLLSEQRCSKDRAEYCKAPNTLTIAE
jgi:hypothetical protein